MKFIITMLLASIAICFAAPTPSVEHSRRDTIQEQETDTLLFTDSMTEFQTARDAQDPSDLDWYSNGCTASPDQPLGYNFLPSCQRHDFGYHNYKNQDRFTEQNKDRIDSNFKSDLYNECATRGSVSKTVCEGIADIYYEAVSTFGGRR